MAWLLRLAPFSVQPCRMCVEMLLCSSLVLVYASHIIIVGIHSVIESQIFGYIYPVDVSIECVFVGIEAVERSLITIWTGVHGCIVLVAECQTGTGLTFAVGFLAWATQGLHLVALELALTACETGNICCKQERTLCGSERTHQPLRDLMTFIQGTIRRQGRETTKET